MRNPFDCYTIQVAKQDHYQDCIQLVNRRAPRLWRIVDQFAMYLKREQHYDFPLFDVDGDGRNVAAYLFGHGGMWIGACALSETRPSPLDRDVPPWILDWVWLHPYQRGRGLLRRAWQQLEAEHGQFLIRAPLSRAAEGFVEALGLADRVVMPRHVADQ